MPQLFSPLLCVFEFAHAACTVVTFHAAAVRCSLRKGYCRGRPTVGAVQCCARRSRWIFARRRTVFSPGARTGVLCIASGCPLIEGTSCPDRAHNTPACPDAITRQRFDSMTWARSSAETIVPELSKPSGSKFHPRVLTRHPQKKHKTSRAYSVWRPFASSSSSLPPPVPWSSHAFLSRFRRTCQRLS